jgi:hypothetical protein
VSYVFGDMAGQLDSPLYGLFAIRDTLDKAQSAVRRVPGGAVAVRH